MSRDSQSVSGTIASDRIASLGFEEMSACT